jgi:N-methylhydantoinase A
MVNMRLGMIGKRPKLAFPRLGKGRAAAARHHRNVYFADARKPARCPVYDREALKAGARIDGPAIVQELGTTTVLFKGDRCTVAPSGELIIKVGGA